MNVASEPALVREAASPRHAARVTSGCSCEATARSHPAVDAMSPVCRVTYVGGRTRRRDRELEVAGIARHQHAPPSPLLEHARSDRLDRAAHDAAEGRGGRRRALEEHEVADGRLSPRELVSRGGLDRFARPKTAD